MSIRTLIEINHDYLSRKREMSDVDLAAWARQLISGTLSFQSEKCPHGVEVVHSRHHSDPCPVRKI